MVGMGFTEGLLVAIVCVGGGPQPPAPSEAPGKELAGSLGSEWRGCLISHISWAPRRSPAETRQEPHRGLCIPCAPPA